MIYGIKTKLLAGVICLSAVFVSAETLGNYEAERTLSERLRNKVYRDNVKPQYWLGDTFGYRNHLSGGRYEYIFVDASTGERRPAFDLSRLEQALSEIGLGLEEPDKLFLAHWSLDQTGKILNFRMKGKDWICNLDDYKLSQKGDSAPAQPFSTKMLHSRYTGEVVYLTFVNQLDKPIKIFWVNGDDQRQYGVLQPGDSYRQHTFEGHIWRVSDSSDRTIAVVEASAKEDYFEFTPERVKLTLEAESNTAKEEKEQSSPATVPQQGVSPDGSWRAEVRNNNVCLHHIPSGEETILTEDGNESDGYEPRVFWAPDSRHFIVLKSTHPEERKIHFVESTPKDQLQPKLHTLTYVKPGDPLPFQRPKLFSVEKKSLIPVSEEEQPNPWSISHFQWAPDSKTFYYLYNRRGHQRLALLAIDAESGAIRVVAEENSETFIDYSNKTLVHPIFATGELIWMSERDGWNHLYLYDLASGNVKKQITSGEWVVRKIERLDDEKRQIWFWAGGIYPEQDPYYLHLARVNYDGTGFVILTKGNGTHTVEFSPDGKWFLDRYSRVDLPPITELRRSSDGALVCELEKADASELIAAGWVPQERFTAKGRDGSTDIYGVITRPTHFDPNKKYPVIEEIYAGPHGSFTQKSFSPENKRQRMAELGFIVVQMDGMGTNDRGKKFHDVCWKNLGDSGFPDRILWIKAAAEKYPYMDIEHVGIYGGSAGGQSSTRALLAYGDFYKVAVSDCGCHDNRMDKIWWNEAWMGWPIGEHYAEQSNVTQAHRLKGKLFLTVGEVDSNVDPASTMQVVKALIDANRDFEMLVIPGANHGAGEHPYANRKRMEFFVRHLLDEPVK